MDANYESGLDAALRFNRGALALRVVQLEAALSGRLDTARAATLRAELGQVKALQAEELPKKPLHRRGFADVRRDYWTSYFLSVDSVRNEFREKDAFLSFMAGAIVAG